MIGPRWVVPLTAPSACAVNRPIAKTGLRGKLKITGKGRKKRIHTTRHAVTLIELLVVIGIIAILGSLLLPTLGRAKLRTTQTACLSGIRQLNLAVVLYAEDNEDRLPYNLGVSEIKDN